MGGNGHTLTMAITHSQKEIHTDISLANALI